VEEEENREADDDDCWAMLPLRGVTKAVTV